MRHKLDIMNNPYNNIDDQVEPQPIYVILKVWT